jgi:hypothetical protein
MAGTPISCPLHRISVSSQDHRFPLYCNASIVTLAHLDALLATANMLQRPPCATKNNRLLHWMHWEVFEVLLLLAVIWCMNDKQLILLLCSHASSPKVLDLFLRSLVLSVQEMLSPTEPFALAVRYQPQSKVTTLLVGQSRDRFPVVSHWGFFP